MPQYIIYAKDYTDTDAVHRRMEARSAHFEGVKALKARGCFIVGGALLNEDGRMIGSMMVLEFPTRADLDAWYAQEPYVIGKVWENVEIHQAALATFDASS
ncbi:MAG: YciI family protein [Bacteroidota bacterium]|nr:YciI family protein [Candidatus Kapabacteria bacterium]MDW8220638.1 YciI family protein [Bacteroidota bacterium]